MGANTNPDQLLAEIFLGKTTSGSPAFDGLFSGTVVTSDTTSVTVTVTGFDGSGKSTFTCKYEKRPGASPATPPAGTDCLVAFPGALPSAAGAPVTSGAPWVVAFTGWP